MMRKKLLRGLTISMFVVGAVIFTKTAISAVYNLPDGFLAPAPVMATGFIKSYDVNGVTKIDGSVKDDGYYQSGAKMYDRDGVGGITIVDRFEKDTNNGTTLDYMTGLMWMTNANKPAATMTWAAALQYAVTINTGAVTENGGYTDWRVPTIKELQSLISWEQTLGLPENIGSVFDSTQGQYWSSTSYAADPAGFAWSIVYSGVHGPAMSSKATNHYVWLVRGPLSE